jgi:hypothetical protein
MLMWLGVVAILTLLVVVAAAIVPGSHSARTASFSRLSVAGRSSPANTLGTHQDKVFGSSIPASRYGTKVAEQESGTGANGQLISDLSPISPRAFNRPIAEYRRYAEGWAAKLTTAIGPLRSALQRGDRAAAKRAWSVAFSDYLHLGAVYGLLPSDLTDRLAGVPQSVSETRFSGLHRIEKGLWTGESLRSLLPLVSALRPALTALRHTLPTVPIDTLDYTLRAHEILEDAQRDLMSDAQVPWSQAGVLGTVAGVAATREVIRTLAPLLQGRDNTLEESENTLAQLQQTFDGVRLRDGQWPTISQLSQYQRERINGALAGTLAQLQEVPGTLETTSLPTIPQLPKPK